jgi:hypothetical protein
MKAPWKIVGTYDIADIEAARKHRDGLRYAKVAAQMIVTGDIVCVQVPNRPPRR